MTTEVTTNIKKSGRPRKIRTPEEQEEFKKEQLIKDRERKKQWKINNPELLKAQRVRWYVGYKVRKGRTPENKIKSVLEGMRGDLNSDLVDDLLNVIQKQHENE